MSDILVPKLPARVRGRPFEKGRSGNPAGRQPGFVRAKIADLRAMARVLAEAVRRCDSGELPGCPLIDTLSASSPLHLAGRSRGRNSNKAA